MGDNLAVSGSAPPKVDGKQRAVEQRHKIRDWIRNERDTVQMKWLVLQETCNSQDRNKERFERLQEVRRTRDLPLAVTKLIKTLKKNVRKEIRDVGGSAQSIIRNMCLYWDADCDGKLSFTELKKCINSLGADIADSDVRAIIDYYDKGVGQGLLDYKTLLEDVAQGEPTLFEYVDNEEEIDVKERYVTKDDKLRRGPMPLLVQQFIEALRIVIARKMRNEGGTPHSHLRESFLKFDIDFSNDLDVNELVFCLRRYFKLKVTEEQTKAIIDYYDTTGSKKIVYDQIVMDVTKNLNPLLYHEELTKETINEMIEKEKNNPMINAKFEPRRCKAVDEFIKKVTASIENKLRSEGGTINSVVRGAFLKLDPKLSGFIDSPDHLRYAVRKFGFTITEEDARVIMRNYDRLNDGRMDYNLIARDIVQTDPSIIEDASYLLSSKWTPTSRTPPDVVKTLKLIESAVDRFVIKSQGDVVPKDLVLGTLARFDRDNSNRLDLLQLTRALAELRVSISPEQISKMIFWFDSDASNRLDIRSMVNQLYGNDILIRNFEVPDRKKKVVPKCGGYSETFAKSLPPLMTPRGTHSLEVQETEIEKRIRRDERRKIMLAEKQRLLSRLQLVEEQKKHILERRKLEKNAERQQQIIAQHQQFHQNRSNHESLKLSLPK
jgi:Ca2+-binding EF-hand superfamily protein